MSETASEIFGQRERPYDMRWGTPDQVKDQFGINVAALKAAWKRGWVRARQGNWDSDEKRTQTVYCFEDIHGWLERVAHQASEAYAEKWWTDETVGALEEKMPDGPYARSGRRGQQAACDPRAAGTQRISGGTPGRTPDGTGESGETVNESYDNEGRPCGSGPSSQGACLERRP